MIQIFILNIFLQSGKAIEQIKDKIETAPNKGYEIGVAIGTFLPMILFFIIVYFVFKKVKDRKDF
jgi:hypothetical protein